MNEFDKSILSLGINGLCYTGSIRTEEDFLKNAYKLSGNVNDKGEDIISRNPDDFGVTWKQIEVQMKIEEKKYSDTQYQRDREPNYPKLEEQFDLLWHAIDDETLDKTSDFYTQLKAVKDDNPKP